MSSTTNPLGMVSLLWRYPVKSMQGEKISSSDVTERGLLGDRAFAVMERATGHIASAKHPHKWHTLFQCRAAFEEQPRSGAPLPPVLITLPDGGQLSSAHPDVDTLLSRALGREVVLLARAPSSPTREADRTPIDQSQGSPIIREERMGLGAPTGTFFDYAPVHLLTTATLEQLQALYPEGIFDPLRFRPNVLVSYSGEEQGFVENRWPGHSLSIGRALRLSVIDPTPRCVVTTLAQGELPRDREILRTIARYSEAKSATLARGVVYPAVAGVYGSVRQPGVVATGDTVWLGQEC